MNIKFPVELSDYKNMITRPIRRSDTAITYFLGDDYLLSILNEKSPLQGVLKTDSKLLGAGLLGEVIATGETAESLFVITKRPDGDLLFASGGVDQAQLARDLAAYLLEFQSIEPQSLDLTLAMKIAFAPQVEPIRTTIASQPCGNDQIVYNTILDQGLTEPEGPDSLVAGNIDPNYIMVANGKLTGFLCLPEMGWGDSCYDLAISYEYFDKEARQIFLDSLKVDESTKKRARNWALAKAMASLKTDETAAMKTMYNIFEEYYS